MASPNFSDFTQEESAVLLKAFYELGDACVKTPERGSDGLKYFKEGLALANNAGIKDSKEVGYLYFGLACGLLLQKRFDEFLVNFYKANELLREVKFDRFVYFTFAMVHFFAIRDYISQGKTEKVEAALRDAEKEMERSEEFVEKSLIDSLRILLYTYLAWEYDTESNFEKVYEYARKAIDRIDENFGPNDSSNITPFNLLARSLLSQRKFDDALLFAQKLNQILSHNHGAQEKKIAIENLVNLGKIYTGKLDFAHAVEFSQKALKLCSESEQDKVLQEQIQLKGWSILTKLSESV